MIGRGDDIVVEPPVMIREYQAVWARPKLNLSELARLRRVEGWPIKKLQRQFRRCNRTIREGLLATELQAFRGAHKRALIPLVDKR